MQMPDFSACLHLCSDGSAAGAIKMALRQETGIRGTPILISDMLENAGPLALLDKPQARLDWFGSVGFDIHIYKGFSGEGTQALVDQWQEFWTRIDHWSGPFTIWFSSANAEDRSLLLAAVNRIAESREVILIDVAEPAGNLPGISGVGEMSPENLRLWIPLAERLDLARRQRLSEDYDRFEASPLALRLFSEGELIKAPIEALDDRILSRLTAAWAPLARTCAGIEGAFGNVGFRDFPYTWLLWRLDVLKSAGRLERRGGAFDPTFMEDPFKGEVCLAG
ncbi:MAG: DUF3658 domain-containing protein [Hyphomonas sp.]